MLFPTASRHVFRGHADQIWLQATDQVHGDYLLDHNSPWLGGAAYYYRDFDLQGGAQQRDPGAGRAPAKR